MTPLARALAERIRSDGPLSVEAYMEACNAFYYATRDPLGTAGDFTTAPEIHQMFGEMVGAALADVWSRAGKPGDAVYAELGPGRGTLANDALRVLRRAGFEGEAHLVETSPALREAQSKLLPEARFHDDIGSLPRAAASFREEFFDALPIRHWSKAASAMSSSPPAVSLSIGMVRSRNPRQRGRSSLRSLRSDWRAMAARRSSSIMALPAASRATRYRPFTATVTPMSSIIPASRT